MRIAVGGIRHETNSFSTVHTTLDDFVILRGPAIVDAALAGQARIDGIEIVPLVSAHASPNGLVELHAYEALADELTAGLAHAGHIDGVYLDLHGAMDVEGIGDGESDLLARVRTVIGHHLPLAISLDLHGNLAPSLVHDADIMTAFRTAPHRDTDVTRMRALHLLADAIRSGRTPRTLMIKPPILIPGEYAVTESEPAHSLYASVAGRQNRPGVLDASLLIGCAWTDSEYTSTAVLVVYHDVAAAEATAREFAQAVWDRRAEFGPDVETGELDEAIRRALAATESSVFISDSGDNVTAGAAGDTSVVARSLVAAGAPDAVVGGLCDPAAVALCAIAGIGATVDLSIGGKLDALNDSPFAVRGIVTGLGPAGRSAEYARVLVGGVLIVLTVDRRAFTSRADFAAVGIDALSHRIVVVKLGYLFPDLRDHAPRAIMALTPGFTDLRLHLLPYRRITRPIHPLDPAFTWTSVGVRGP